MSESIGYSPWRSSSRTYATIARRYRAPANRGGTPGSPSQQLSFSGTRTALACQRAIARTEAAVAGPSKMPWPWTQAYSVPERLTPWMTTTWPRASSRRLPATWRPLAFAAGPSWRGARLVAGAGAVVADGAPRSGAAALAQPTSAATHAAAVPAAARRRAGRRLRLAAGTLRAHPRVGAERQRPAGAQDLRGDERRGARHRAVRGRRGARRPQAGEDVERRRRERRRPGGDRPGRRRAGGREQRRPGRAGG